MLSSENWVMGEYELIWSWYILLFTHSVLSFNFFNLFWAFCPTFYILWLETITTTTSLILIVSIAQAVNFENVSQQHFDGHLPIFDFRWKPSLSIFLVESSTVPSLPMGSPKPAGSWNSRCPWWSGWKVSHGRLPQCPRSGASGFCSIDFLRQHIESLG